MRMIAAAFAVLGLIGAAQAQEAPVSAMSADEFVSALTPEPRPLTRSARTRGITPTVAMDVNFEFASARLTPEAETLLTSLAQALQAPALESLRFELAGHTDAVGTHEVNDRLSLERAEAVRDFLVQGHGLDPARLEVSGHGKRRLLFPDAPEDGRNRRVDIATLIE